jgi:hypothetical protein
VPEQRYQSAAELRKDLAALQRPEPFFRRLTRRLFARS